MGKRTARLHMRHHPRDQTRFQKGERQGLARCRVSYGICPVEQEPRPFKLVNGSWKGHRASSQSGVTRVRK